MSPPIEYVRFSQKRRVWQELGQHMDDMEHGELQEALLFMRLEDKYKPKPEK